MSASETVVPDDLYVTAELHRRVPKTPDYRREKIALQDIAAQMIDHPERVLPKLVELAMEMTGATSSGISAYEEQEGTPGIFRWRDLQGELAPFEGATTPRDYSPCGICLDRFEPTLTRRPERFYSWIAEAGVSCPEVLLVPLYMAHGQPLGTLWIVSPHEGYFDRGDARVMQELASFVGIALAVLHDQQRLREAMAQKDLLLAEMNHRVKNLFATADALINVTRRSATSPAEMAKALSGRLHALSAAHSLVRRSFSIGDNRPLVASLHDLVDRILKPYELPNHERFLMKGADIGIGEQAASGLALVLHELATNAAKYGALARDEGQLTVTCEQQGDKLRLQWRESGGLPVKGPPDHQGFGSTLVRRTVQQQFEGTFSLNWQAEGLIGDFLLSAETLGR